ncbi:MAG: DUF2855 family protein [Pseudomonadota bacterium]
MNSVQLVVARNDLKSSKVIETPLPSLTQLPEDGLLVKVDRFAFTANNITYAILGDQLKYWDLFPAPEGFGIIPVWGFGEVIETRHPEIAKGEILFGYFPMASHLVIEAKNLKRNGFSDGAPHRQNVSPVYNAYSRVSGDPAFAGREGDYQALLRPLFMLSFLVDDFLAENEFFGAKSVILSSASSKTAFGLAWLLRTFRKPIRVIGLTSSSNADFVKSLGCYDEIVTYDEIEKMPAASPVAFVDMAGSGDILARLHRHFGEQMKYSCRVGLTHQDGTPGGENLPGAKPRWFFAPDQIRKRAKEWGPGGLDQRFGAAFSPFTKEIGSHLNIVSGRGADAVQKIYLDTLNGRVKPDEAHMLSMAN